MPQPEPEPKEPDNAEGLMKKKNKVKQPRVQKSSKNFKHNNKKSNVETMAAIPSMEKSKTSSLNRSMIPSSSFSRSSSKSRTSSVGR